MTRPKYDIYFGPSQSGPTHHKYTPPLHQKWKNQKRASSAVLTLYIYSKPRYETRKKESLKAAVLDCSWLPVVFELSALLLLLSFFFSFCDAGKAFRYLWELSGSCHHLGFVRGLIDWLIDWFPISKFFVSFLSIF